ncbi:MAG TPA: hypothetical protein VLG47_07560 [Candidatus Saccharimonadales bacterium]|nr:hypothetical protein [Candidatus Saccharimonadales bacterium]
MKKSTKILLASVAVLLVIGSGTIAVRADSKAPEHPDWVQADGKVNLNKISDNDELPYQCWNGKNIKLTGKAYKKMADSQAAPGSDEYKTGVDKMNDLRKIPGAVVQEGGGETVNIDDNNPAIVGVMKKYEKKEMPQCQ